MNKLYATLLSLSFMSSIMAFSSSHLNAQPEVNIKEFNKDTQITIPVPEISQDFFGPLLIVSCEIRSSQLNCSALLSYTYNPDDSFHSIETDFYSYEVGNLYARLSETNSGVVTGSVSLERNIDVIFPGSTERNVALRNHPINREEFQNKIISSLTTTAYSELTRAYSRVCLSLPNTDRNRIALFNNLRFPTNVVDSTILIGNCDELSN